MQTSTCGSQQCFSVVSNPTWTPSFIFVPSNRIVVFAFCVCVVQCTKPVDLAGKSGQVQRQIQTQTSTHVRTHSVTQTHKHDPSPSSPWRQGVRWFRCRTGSLVTSTSGGAVLAWATDTISRIGCNMQNLSKTPQVFVMIYVYLWTDGFFFISSRILDLASSIPWCRMGGFILFIEGRPTVRRYCLLVVATPEELTRHVPFFIRSFVLPSFHAKLSAFVPSRPWNSIPCKIRSKLESGLSWAMGGGNGSRPVTPASIQ